MELDEGVELYVELDEGWSCMWSWMRGGAACGVR